MKELINLCLQTEFSFKRCYGFVKNIPSKAVNGFVGIADIDSTYGHPVLEMACQGTDIKPLYGVRLHVVEDPLHRIAGRKSALPGHSYVLLARNQDGLAEIYELVRLSWELKYYVPCVSFIDVMDLNEDNVVVIARSWAYKDKIQFAELSVKTPKSFINKDPEISRVAINCNYFDRPEDRNLQQLLAGVHKRVDGYQFGFETHTYPQHILTTKEWFRLFKNEEAINNTHKIAEMCGGVKLRKAKMVKAANPQNIRILCRQGAIKRRLIFNDEYVERLDHELNIIIGKDFVDYFLIVYDIVQKAKKKMVLSPGRGSCGGSLVCYLLFITEIDPIYHGLLFERFLDEHRPDWPDIDLDFPDYKRESVIVQTKKDYGLDKVASISTISRFMPRLLIGEFAKSLNVPSYETSIVKDALIEEPEKGRRNLILTDTFEQTEAGKDFIEKFPRMKICERAETHAKTTGIHAAGIIICNENLTNYVGVDYRDKKIMADLNTAEYLGLMKIDFLGLRTLTILQETAKLAGFHHDDFYSVDYEDKKVYSIFNKMRLAGVFQFDGDALKAVTRNMGCHCFNDIVIITALARPGPMQGGTVTKYCNVRNKTSELDYLSDNKIIIEITKETLGCIIYQEQIMKICRQYGKMTEKNVNIVRRGMGKSKGEDFINQYRDEFIKGGIESGDPEDIVEYVWNKLLHFGKYGFNKCISGDTEVIIAYPNETIERLTSISDLHYHYIKYPNSYTKRTGAMPTLLSLYPDGKCKPQKVKSIIYNGLKQCFRYYTEDGKHFECTKDHRFIINGEWQEIGMANVGDNLGRGIYSGTKRKLTGVIGKGKKYDANQQGFNSGEENIAFINGKTERERQFKYNNLGLSCEDCDIDHDRMEAHHNDFNKGFDSPDNMSWLCPGCHKKRHYKHDMNKQWQVGYEVVDLKIIAIESVGEKKTYDIEMPEHHNYLIEGGIITHNSHSVGYAMVSFWTAYCKFYHPLEYAVATLNHAKDDEHAIEFLREVTENDGLEFVSLDAKKSDWNYSVIDGKIYGGFINLPGVGKVKAMKIVKDRLEGNAYTKAIARALENPWTPFDDLYPCKTKYKKLYDNPLKYGINDHIDFIKNILVQGEYCFIGRVILSDMKDANDHDEVLKRKGELIKDENTKFIDLVIADDTDKIRARINRFVFDKLGGDEIFNSIVNDKTYLICRGSIVYDFRMIQITQIFNLDNLDID